MDEVGFDEGPVAHVRLLPNLRVLGPRLGAKVPAVKAALERGEAEELGDGRVRVAGEELAADEVIRGERVEIPGWAIADDVTLSIAIDTAIDPELALRGRVYELIHTVNTMRKDAGLELTDRIVLDAPRRRRPATPRGLDQGRDTGDPHRAGRCAWRSQRPRCRCPGFACSRQRSGTGCPLTVTENPPSSATRTRLPGRSLPLAAFSRVPTENGKVL